METHPSSVAVNRRRPAWLLPLDESGPESTVRASPIPLSREEAGLLFGAAMDERATDAQIGAALVALAVKGETDELRAATERALESIRSGATLGELEALGGQT